MFVVSFTFCLGATCTSRGYETPQLWLQTIILPPTHDISIIQTIYYYIDIKLFFSDMRVMHHIAFLSHWGGGGGKSYPPSRGRVYFHVSAYVLYELRKQHMRSCHDLVEHINNHCKSLILVFKRQKYSRIGSYRRPYASCSRV